MHLHVFRLGAGVDIVGEDVDVHCGPAVLLGKLLIQRNEIFTWKRIFKLKKIIF